MLKELYNKTMQWAEHPQAGWALFVVAFIESIIFPIPPDVLLIALVVATPQRAWRYGLICTVGSVAGGVTAYFIGRYFFDEVAAPMLNVLCAHDEKFCADTFIALIKGQFDQWGAWIVAMSSVSIFPYKLVTITAGVVEMNLLVFTVTSIVGRGFRFFLIAWLLKQFGDQVRHFIENHLVWVFNALCALIILFLIYRYFILA